MKLWKKIGLIIAGILAALLLMAVWYLNTHKMEEADSFEVNDPSATNHILIATQGSVFKDSVVNGVVSRLRSEPVYIKVIDVSALPEVKEEEWTSIVLLHTWEYAEPQKDAKLFADMMQSRDKLIVLTTSGDGTYALPGADGITSASQLSDVTPKAEEITRRINQLINKNNKTMEVLEKYKIKEINWPEKTFIAKRATVGFDKLTEFFTENYDAIYGELGKLGIEPKDAPYAIYHSIDEEKMVTELSAAVSVEGKLPEMKGFEVVKLPPSKIITTTYYGPYEKIAPAYTALEKYLAKHNLKRELMLEQYVSDPMVEKDSSKLRTEIYFVVK